jgi:DNA polymerase III alpha subunit
MDIDIDLPTSFDPLDYFKEAVRASMLKDNDLVKHNAGAYLQTIPKDPVTGLSAIPYKEAEELGYFKIDFLHLALLDDFGFETKQQMRDLLEVDPNWDLLQNEEVVEKLFQVSKHYALLLKLQPESVQELADCIALLRPAKKNLVNKYITNPVRTRKELYQMPLPPGCFKKGHALAYALTIVLQLHFIEAGLL